MSRIWTRPPRPKGWDPGRRRGTRLRLLRLSELGAAYEDAWTSWAESDDAGLWDAATAAGLP